MAKSACGERGAFHTQKFYQGIQGRQPKTVLDINTALSYEGHHTALYHQPMSECLQKAV